MEKPEEQPTSKFRDFLVPNLQNTLQSASFQHKIGNYKQAKRFLDAATEGLKKCYEQNALDEAAAEENQGNEEN